MHRAAGDGHHRAGDLAAHIGGLGQLQFVRGLNVALHPAGDHNIRGADVALPATALAQHQDAFEIALALYLAINNMVVLALKHAHVHRLRPEHGGEITDMVEGTASLFLPEGFQEFFDFHDVSRVLNLFKY